MPFILLTSLIVIHELGHFLCAIYFKVETDKIYLYPFGGISKFNLSFNEPIWKELLILCMGPIFQIIFFNLLIHINFLSHYYQLITIYNYTILLFNLLPIYPLDGGKLLNLILSSQIAFKKSLNYSLIISYFTVFILFCYMMTKDLSINILVITSFLFYKIGVEVRQKKYIIDKFLLERYLNNYNFKKRKSVLSIDYFMRNRYHLIKIGDKYYTEKEILKKKFNK